MNFQTDNVQWTRNLEEFLKMLGEHSLCLSVLHKDSERHFSGKAMFIDLPVIVFSTVCGSLTLSAKNIFGESNENDALKFVGTLSLITGILGTIQSYFGYNRSAENHRISYLQYSKLYRFIKIQLGLPREQRILPKDLLKIVIENFERLNEISNLIPDGISQKFRKKYKKETLKRPEIVNGLEEIEIYSLRSETKDSDEGSEPRDPGIELDNAALDLEQGLSNAIRIANSQLSKDYSIGELTSDMEQLTNEIKKREKEQNTEETKKIEDKVNDSENKEIEKKASTNEILTESSKDSSNLVV